MLVAHYPTKKALREHVGRALRFSETSLFGPEYRDNGTVNVVGPSAYDRKWYATVTVTDGLIRTVK